MSWLKAEAPLNIMYIILTPEVSHAPMSWLKAEASWNIKRMLVTPEVSHAPISSLKEAAAEPLQKPEAPAQNKYSMSVTADVSHVEMWPYVDSAALGSENHAATAVLMLLSVMA